MKKKYCLIPFLIFTGMLIFSVPVFADKQDSTGFCLPTQEQVESYKADNSLQERIDYYQNNIKTEIDPVLIQNIKRTENDSFKKKVPSNWEGGMSTTGEGRVLVLMVDFPDMPLDTSNTVEKANELFFKEPNATDFLYPYESIKAYYQRSSYGKLNLNGDVAGIYHAKKNRNDYEQDVFQLMKEALDYYDRQGLDFGQYDGNNDGVIDCVYLKFAGPNTGWGSTWWSCMRTYSDPAYQLDGKKLNKTVWLHNDIGESAVEEMSFVRTVIHETGHVLGLPDYYDPLQSFSGDNLNGGSKTLDMMDHNIFDHNAFSKILLGWITQEDIVIIDKNTPQKITLKSVNKEPSAAIIFPDCSDFFSEFYLVEYVTSAENNEKLPYGAPREIPNGVRIFHINAELTEDGRDFKYDNAGSDIKLIEAVDKDENTLHPHAMLSEVRYSEEYDYYNCLYYEGDTFTPYTKPASFRYPKNGEADGNGEFSGVSISNIQLSSTEAIIEAVVEKSPEKKDIKIESSKKFEKVGTAFNVTFVTNVPVWKGDVGPKIIGDGFEADMEMIILGNDYLSVSYRPEKTGQFLESNATYELVFPKGTLVTSYGQTNDVINIPIQTDYLINQQRLLQYDREDITSNPISFSDGTIAYIGENIENHTLSFYKVHPDKEPEGVLLEIPYRHEVEDMVNEVFIDNQNLMIFRIYDYNNQQTRLFQINQNGEIVDSRVADGVYEEYVPLNQGILMKNGFQYAEGKMVFCDFKGEPQIIKVCDETKTRLYPLDGSGYYLNTYDLGNPENGGDYGLFDEAVQRIESNIYDAQNQKIGTVPFLEGRTINRQIVKTKEGYVVLDQMEEKSLNEECSQGFLEIRQFDHQFTLLKQKKLENESVFESVERVENFMKTDFGYAFTKRKMAYTVNSHTIGGAGRFDEALTEMIFLDEYYNPVGRYASFGRFDGLQTQDDFMIFGNIQWDQQVQKLEPVFEIRGISIFHPPNKALYLQGETLRTDGGVIAVQREGLPVQYIAIEEKMCSNYSSDKAGEQIVTVTYGKKTCTFKIDLIMRGDLNGNGTVDIMDARKAKRAAMKEISLTENELAVADLNGDGKVDIMETRKIKRAAMKEIDLQ